MVFWLLGGKSLCNYLDCMEGGIRMEFEYQGKMNGEFLYQPHNAGTKEWQLSVWENKNGKAGMYHCGQQVDT
jgi:hypothetical protein